MTEDKRQREIKRFFDEQLLPLAAQLKAQGLPLLDAGPEPSAASYFIPRQQRRMTPADFDQGGLTSPESAAQDIRKVWSATAGHPLAPLADSVARLAVDLRQGQEQSGDVSTFIYAMY
ncbi:MAG: hypothetical protein LW854_15970 [Rubrivivax sp.]|nr:hypothetical protein [Rubrivivax sp.]